MQLLCVGYSNKVFPSLDEKNAFDLCNKCASNRQPAVFYALGLHYLNGTGTEKNEKKAFDWLHKAAVLNHPFALEKVSWMYLHGIGVNKNIYRSLEYSMRGQEFLIKSFFKKNILKIKDYSQLMSRFFKR
jgi:TPR repeat protein